MSRSRTSILIACLLIGSLAGRSGAQNEPAFDPEARGLDPRPFVNDSIGLTIYPPAGATVAPVQIGASTTVTIQEGADPPTWQVRIQPMVGPNRPAAADVAQQLLTQFRRDDPEVKVLADEAVTYSSRSGHLLYVERRTSRGDGLIQGFLILPTGTERFMVFRIETFPEDFARVRPLLNASFSTIQLASQDEVRALRQSQRDRAERFIASVTPERLKALVGRDAWFRIHRPHPSGDWMQDEEIGYFRLRVSQGRRGELTPERAETSYTPAEREVGLILTLEGKYVADPARAIFIDVRSLFWLAWDRSEETWAIRATQRQGDAARTEGETGVRSKPSPGHPYGELHVVNSSVEEMDRDARRWIVTDSTYVSQAEVYLLGALLPRDGSITGDMTFRYYEPSLPNAPDLPQRFDTWAKATDGTDRWVLTSVPFQNAPTITTYYDADGDIIRREKEGTITVPIDLDQLTSIWRRKGLPTGG